MELLASGKVRTHMKSSPKLTQAQQLAYMIYCNPALFEPATTRSRASMQVIQRCTAVRSEIWFADEEPTDFEVARRNTDLLVAASLEEVP